MKNTYRILANGIYMNNNTYETGLNNNDLIVGPSGAGKTRNYVKPNIMQCNDSMIIADTKSNLLNELGPLLQEKGYKIYNLNFKDIRVSSGYNPFDFVRYDERAGKYNEQDILTNQCGGTNEIYKILQEEQERDAQFFQAVPQEYSVKKHESLNGKNLKHILNEGTGRCDDFEKKVELTKEFMQLLGGCEGWKCSPDSLLDLKVYYRELFIYKSKYKTKAINTVKKVMNPDEEIISISDFKFLSSKINRGYFRETNPIELFDKLNEITPKIYSTLIDILLFYDLEENVYYSLMLTLVMHRLAFSGINQGLIESGKEPIVF